MPGGRCRTVKQGCAFGHSLFRVKGNGMFSNRELKKLIVPLIIEQILAVTVGMADVMMVSRVGEAAVSGVSLVDMINVLIINIFAALATGGAVITEQYIGKKSRIWLAVQSTSCFCPLL